jgi:hypothetical protein
MCQLEHRIRGIIGGDQIDFDGDTAAYTGSMPSLKILLSAVVSQPCGKFATVDIKVYCLGTPLADSTNNTLPFLATTQTSIAPLPRRPQILANNLLPLSALTIKPSLYPVLTLPGTLSPVITTGPEQRMVALEPPPKPQQRLTELPLEKPKEQRMNEATLYEDAPRSRRATTEHSAKCSCNRRNQKEMKIATQRLSAYECTADEYDFAFPIMVQRRFNGNRKCDR